jgi:hypothetical protein
MLYLKGVAISGLFVLFVAQGMDKLTVYLVIAVPRASLHHMVLLQTFLFYFQFFVIFESPVVIKRRAVLLLRPRGRTGMICKRGVSVNANRRTLLAACTDGWKGFQAGDCTTGPDVWQIICPDLYR